MKLKRFTVYYTEKIEKEITISAMDEPDAWERFEISNYNDTFDKPKVTEREIEIDCVEESKEIKW